MDKQDQLFVRACKSKHPFTRVLSTYMRFYLGTNGNKYRSEDIASVLARLCEKYLDIPLRKILDAMNPENDWKYTANGDGYWDKVCAVLISEIRLTEVSVFENYVTPAKFREGNG